MKTKKGQRLSAYTEKDLKKPLRWLAGLSSSEFTCWLRSAITARDGLPVNTAHADDFAVQLAETLQGAPKRLRDRLQESIPILIQEWGDNDGERILEDLLTLCAILRCSSASATIVRIADRGLADVPRAVEMRQTCLSVLSGFGCTQHTKWIFTKFLAERPYAALCYRALYDYDRSLAAANVDKLFQVYRRAEDRAELEDIFRFLFFERSDAEVVELARQFVFDTSPSYLEPTVELLAAIDIHIDLPASRSATHRLCEVTAGSAPDSRRVLGTFPAPRPDTSCAAVLISVRTKQMMLTADQDQRYLLNMLSRKHEAFRA